MRVSRLGNSLMVRVPAAVVAALHLKEGDDVEILGTSDGQSYMVHEPAPQERQKGRVRERPKMRTSKKA